MDSDYLDDSDSSVEIGFEDVSVIFRQAITTKLINAVVL